MNIRIFNKTYWFRRFGSQSTVKGYVTTPHRDFAASLNVHPPSADTIQALPEGERKVKRLEASGTDVLLASDQARGIKGDLLYYHGDWYECISAIEWDHTILNHWEYVFVLVPKDAAGTVDLAEPEGEPTASEGGDDDEGEWR